MSDFITCENKDLYSWEALIKQTIGQDDGEFYWKVKAVLGEDYYFFDHFEQVSGVNIGSGNLGDPVSLQDFYWGCSGTNWSVNTVHQADPFFGLMRLGNLAGAGDATAEWDGSPFNGGRYKFMKTRFLVNSTAFVSDVIIAGWYASANDYFYLYFVGSTNTNYQIRARNNGGPPTNDDTGIPPVQNEIVTLELRMEGTTISAIVNGTAVTLANATARDIDTFHPYYYYANTNAGLTKNMDIDYIRLYQERG